MFLRNKIIAQRKKLKAEAKAKGRAEGLAKGRAEGMAKGRAKGMAKRDAEWMEWVANGEDPDKMPHKINPVNTKTDKVECPS